MSVSALEDAVEDPSVGKMDPLGLAPAVEQLLDREERDGWEVGRVSGQHRGVDRPEVVLGGL